MKVITMKLSELRRPEKNVRIHTEQQLKIMCQWFERELACKKISEKER